MNKEQSLGLYKINPVKRVMHRGEKYSYEAYTKDSLGKYNELLGCALKWEEITNAHS